MRHRHHCGPRGHIEIDVPEALFGMGGRRGGWQGSWGPFHFDIGDEGLGSGWGGGRRGRRGRRMFESGELRLVLLKLIAEKHGVAPKVIANSDDLDKIAAEGEKADVAAMTGWRRDLFGETALQLIQGQVALRFVGKRIETVTLQQ